MAYPKSFEMAVNHAMLFEVGGFWDENTSGVKDGTNLRACGYVNDPSDAGGETKFGIAKNANPTVNIRGLKWEDAKAIYFDKYWLAGGCDGLSSRLAALHFDGCVNHGIKRAGIFLQRAVGATPDGFVGPGTIAKSKMVDEGAACDTICQLREQFYRSIVAAKPNQGKFLKGWLRRITEMHALVLSKRFVS